MRKKLQWRWIATRSGALVVVCLKAFAGLLLLAAVALPVRAAGLPDAARFSNAIEQGDIAQAREWLDNGLPPDFEGKAIGTGIMIGAWEGNIAMMDLFVSRGADINKANSLGEQALQHAAWRGHLPVVRFSPRAVRIPSAAVRAFIARQARAIVPAPLPFLENRSCAAQQLADVLRRPRPAKRR